MATQKSQFLQTLGKVITPINPVAGAGLKLSSSLFGKKTPAPTTPKLTVPADYKVGQSTVTANNLSASNPKTTTSTFKTEPAQKFIQNQLGNTGMTNTGNTGMNTNFQQPKAPVVSPYSTARDEYIKAYKDYVASLQPSAGVTEAQTKYNDFIASAESGIAGMEGQGRGIPLALVRGQQEKLGRQSEITAKRLQGDLSLEEQRLEQERAAKKAAVDLQGGLLEQEAGLEAPVASGGNLYQKQADGSYKLISGGTTKTPEGFTLGEKQSRYEFNPTTGKYEFIAGGTAAGSGEADAANEFSQQLAANLLTNIDQAIEQVKPWSAGFGSKTLSMIGGTGATNLKASLDAVKANIGFATLQAMRDASKTGGALGQVAVQELTMLQSVLGSLEQDQTPAQLKATLEQIKTHYTKAQTALNQANGMTGGYSGGGTGGGGLYDF